MGVFRRLGLGLICTAFAFNFGWAGFWLWLAGVIALCVTKERPGQVWAIAVIVVTGFIASFQADGRDVDINFGPAPDMDVDGNGILGFIQGVIGFIGWGWLLFGGCVLAGCILRLARERARS